MFDTPRPNRGLLALTLAVAVLPVVLLVLPLVLLVLFSSSQPFDDNLEIKGFDEARSAKPLPIIDPDTPVAKLLPIAPREKRSPVYLGGNLQAVPELMLEAVPSRTPELPRQGEELPTVGQWRSRKERAVAVALHLNAREEDGFLKSLLGNRRDLDGLAFQMGDACRMKPERKRPFKDAAETARQRSDALLAEEATLGEREREQRWLAQTAALAQILPGEEIKGQLLQVRAMASIPRPEATRELARVAVFADDPTVRGQALEALAIRREAGSTEVLVAGLSYPWSDVARNAAGAIARLQRKDLTPHLVKMLDAADPRGPRTEEVDGRTVTVAHELVRLNHLRNCMLCHAPAEKDKSPEDTLVAEMPVPGETLPDTSNGYGRSESNLLVRIDVTYLRQDFSAILPVEMDYIWPAGQRFDFLVRKRVLSPAEADELRGRLAKQTAAEGSPYRQAAEQALRELAGRGAAGGRQAERAARLH
jgi:hypothetical protein